MSGDLYAECGCGDYDEQDDQLLWEEMAYQDARLKIGIILDSLSTGELEDLAAELEERYKETVEEEATVTEASADDDDVPF